MTKKKIIFIFLCLVLIVGMTISTYNIVKWFKDSQETKKEISEIEKLVIIEESVNEEDVEIIEPSKKIAKENPYWDYVKMNLLNVDFSKLKEINSDVAGWISVNGTNVNYPFVQTSNNEYYLNHSFKKEKNSAGWVFLDYRNDINELEKNTIIYAHNRKDQTMFGSLKNVLAAKWYEDIDNRIIKMSSENINTLWQIFSVYTIDTTNDYIKTNFNGDDDYQEFINLIKGRSTANFNTTVTPSDRILTLSTCHGSTKKLVVHAKLIKQEVKST